jgi:ABC-2 type transport system permease protein
MSRILTVAQREFIETVKNKIFILNLILVPVMVVGGMVISTHFARKTVEGPRPAKRIAVKDLSNELSSEFDRVFQQYNKSNPRRQIILTQVGATESHSDSHTLEMKDRVRQGKLDAFVILAKDSINSDGKSYCYIKTRNVTDLDLFATVERLINDAVVNLRFRQYNLSQELYAKVRRWVPLEQVDVSAKAEEKREPLAMLMVPFFFLFLMFLGIIGINQQIMTSVIEEKNSRVMEVILSAVSPFQLMTGKIVGLAAAGLVLVFCWGIAAYGAAAYRGITGIVSIGNLAYFIVYYILGFLLIASVFAAIGSTCNTIKEAQSLMMPVMLIFILPMVTWFYIAQHPEAPMSVVMSYIPPITPMVMILRISAYPELSRIEIAASLILLAASVPAVMWAAAKVFRTGILMYGKPPSVRELLRWLRYS